MPQITLSGLTEPARAAGDVAEIKVDQEQYGSIDRLGRFSSNDLERRYQSERFGETLPTVRIVLLIVAVLSSAFYRSDYVLFGTSPTFVLLAVARTVDVFFAIMLASAIARMRNVGTAQNLLTAWLCIHLLFSLLVGTTRPPEYVLYLLIDLLAVISAYFLIPIGTVRLVAVCVVYSMAELIGLVWKHSEAGELVFIVAIASFAGANLVGAIGVSRMRAALRREYLALDLAEVQSARLAEALANVQTLQGLLPICAHCKKIREADGEWFSLERYVEAHSNAKMTHGICPDCARKHYPDY